MSALTRTQKIILIVFVFLDLAIIAGLVGIIITTMRNTTKQPKQRLSNQHGRQP